MGFWEKKIAEINGTQPPQTNSPVAPSQAPVGAWWSRPGQPQVPSTAPVATTPTNITETATVEQAFALVVDPRLTKAQSARSTATCPECGSGNMRGGMGLNEMTRCFDCGYNPRFQQQAAGIPSDRSGGATPSRQITTGGYNPQKIIGHLG